MLPAVKSLKNLLQLFKIHRNKLSRIYQKNPVLLYPKFDLDKINIF